MSAVTTYGNTVAEKIKNLTKLISGSEFAKASDLLYESLANGGVWHIFGTGHSSMAVQEAFHRAGGLIPVNPWFEEVLMPQAGPKRNGPFERLTGVAQIIFDNYGARAGEVLTLISNSGINVTTVEMAEIAKKNKLKTIAITNLEHSKNTPSRHGQNKKLFEVCDIVLDTGGVKGDAAVEINDLDVPVGPLSTILASFVINSLAVSICEKFSQNKKAAPVYLSANLPGGQERNAKLEAQYISRIPRLR